MNPHPQRILWRCRRGAREMDVLLENYYKSRYDGAPVAEKQAFLALLELPDDKLNRILFGQESPEDLDIRQVVATIRVPPAY